ncbi:MAG: AAA family ATPase, partial [Victivallales bacterium]|nr:AAA family ATPase [Victivallales bacterium]
RPGTPRFKWNADHKLATDVLIVDEASMISQSLMNALLAALPDGVKVIMLGDMLQLASVESGMVLGEFCRTAGSNCFNAEFVADFEQVFPGARGQLESAPDSYIWSGSVIELQNPHRFSVDRGLGMSVAAMRNVLNLADAEKILGRMAADQSGEVAIADLPSWNNFEPKLLSFLKAVQVDSGRYLSFLREQNVERAYELFNKFRILCVHRSGYYGADMINALVEKSLSLYGGKRNFPDGSYRGRPVIINENNYALELFNGDTGMIWPDAAGELKAFFPGTDRKSGKGGSGFRSFNLHLLPAHSPAYAITVHKAQGSGFQQILIITPPEPSPLMTREMLYTAVSRAETRAVLWGKNKLLVQALQRVIRRYSNLAAALNTE